MWIHKTMKCQDCDKLATIHITELTDDGVSERHLCADHGQHLKPPPRPPQTIRLLSLPVEQVARWARFVVRVHVRLCGTFKDDVLNGIMSGIVSTGRIDDAIKVVPSLLESLELQDERGNIALCAAHALHLVGPDCVAVVPALVQALEDDSAILRAYAALSIGLIGPKAALGIPALRAALKDQDELVRNTASRSLKSVDR